MVRSRRMGRASYSAEALRKRSCVEAAILVRVVAEPTIRGESIKARIARAATRLGWTYRRTEDIWRREARRIEAFEMDQLRNYQQPE
jgi:hypothetical protein